MAPKGKLYNDENSTQKITWIYVFFLMVINCLVLKAIIEIIVVHVYSCFVGSSGSSSSSSRDTALAMLTLYEFEASANLGNTPELERILGEVLSNPATEIKMLESMAGRLDK